ADVPGAIGERQRALWTRPLDPVTVAWDGKEAQVQLRLPWRHRDSPVEFAVEFESGDYLGIWADRDSTPPPESVDVGGERYIALNVSILPPDLLQHGYHRI